MTNFKHRNTAVCGAALCFFAVAIGAFGAHALKETLLTNNRVDVFELANRYQFYHGLALLTLAALFNSNPSAPSLRLTTILFMTGIVVFSGSLYGLALTNITTLGAITPIGGVLLLAAWAISICHIVKANDKTQ